MENLKQQILEEFDDLYNEEYLIEKLGESPREILASLKIKDTDTYYDVIDKLQHKFASDFMFNVDFNVLELFDICKECINNKLNNII